MSLHWPLKMAPDEYIEKYGAFAKHSALALEVVSEQDECEFAISSWNGLPNYHCPFCPSATLDLDEMRAHVRGHGTRRPSQQLEED